MAHKPSPQKNKKEEDVCVLKEGHEILTGQRNLLREKHETTKSSPADNDEADDSNVKSRKNEDDAEKLRESVEKMKMKSERHEQEDDEWPILHNWAKDFRYDHAMTITDFFNMLNFQPSLSFIQYLSGSAKIKPSKKPGTKGNQLRTLLKDLKKAIEGMELTVLEQMVNEAKIGSQGDKYKCYIEEWLGELRRHGIENAKVLPSSGPERLELEISVDAEAMHEDTPEKNLNALISSCFRRSNVTVPTVIIKNVKQISLANSLCNRI